MTLTREEILAMEPIELGPVVAEHVFKAKVIGKENFPELRLLIGWFGKEAWKPMKGTWHNAEWRNSEEKAWLDCPRFGEDISAAWEVVEKMRPTHIYELADFGRNKYKDCPHYAAFHPINEPRDYERQVHAKTLPEAICKAALLAILPDKEEETK